MDESLGGSGDALLVSYLDRKGFVGVAVGQRKEVGGPIEKMAMEGADTESLAAPDPHHGLPGSGADEVVAELVEKLGLVAARDEGRVVVDRAACVARDGDEGGEVQVL